MKRSDSSSELIGLYDVIARLMSIALQYGPPKKVGDLLAEAKCASAAPCLGTIAGNTARVYRISSVDICWSSTVVVMSEDTLRLQRRKKAHHDFERARLTRILQEGGCPRRRRGRPCGT